MRVGGTWRDLGRGLFLVFSVVALTLQLAVPPGFMVGGSDRVARIVICTGHGPVNAAIDLGPAPSNGKAKAPCAFAAHGAPANLAPRALISTFDWPQRPAAIAMPADQVSVGGGLAAPPPARAPPGFPEPIV